MRPHITHMVLGGGGLAGIAYIGMIRFLEIELLRKHIHHVAGTSIGAMFATMFALGWTSEEMEARVKNMLVEHGIDLLFKDVWLVLQKYGLDDGTKATEVIAEDLGKITFIDFEKRTGVQLVLCATHVGSMSPTYFSAESTPNVCVIDALRASMAMPWMVCPVRIGEDYYLDGGVTANIPLEPFKDVHPQNVLLAKPYVSAAVARDPMRSPFDFTCALVGRFLSQTMGIDQMIQKYPYFLMMQNGAIGFLPTQPKEQGFHIQLTEKQVDDAITLGYETTHSKIMLS